LILKWRAYDGLRCIVTVHAGDTIPRLQQDLADARLIHAGNESCTAFVAEPQQLCGILWLSGIQQ